MQKFFLNMIFGIIFTGAADADPLAYWRFENGPANTAVSKPFGAVDSSGNGNHLDPWTVAGDGGSRYRSDVGFSQIPQTGAVNHFSIQNSGSNPSMSTRSTNQSYGSGSYPTGINIESVTPAQFTIEAFFKPEGTGSYRTIVGRDAINVATDSAAQAALYFQIKPDDRVKIEFTDVAGYRHLAESSAHVIKGFNFGSDPQGQTGKWYYMAAVSDGSTLSLYLANVSDNGPLWLLTQTDMTVSGSPNTALAKGTQNGTNWHAGSWSVGRGLYNGNQTDRAWGFIDEVRISDTALTPDQFLRPSFPAPPAVKHNPILSGADPDVLLIDNKVWLYPTTGDRDKFYAFSSSTLADWPSRGSVVFSIDSVPWMPAGKWAWAPGVYQKDGVYYLYYSAGPKPSYIGVASSTSPAGPFINRSIDGPLLADYGDSGFEAIDAMAFTDPQTGKSYLYAGGSAGSKLRVFELNPDMVSFHHEITVDTPYLFTEGSFMHYHNGIYYMSYSHGYYKDDSYSMHYSTSSSPTGPWTYQGPLLVSDYQHKGPGHHSFLYNAAMDEWYVFYHRYNDQTGPGPYSVSRRLAIEKMAYNANGTIKPFALTDAGVDSSWVGNFLRADFDESGQVEIEDLLYLSSAWLTNDNRADIVPVGGDNVVDLEDFAAFGLQWLKMPQTH